MIFENNAEIETTENENTENVTTESGYALVDYSIQDGKKHPVAIICPGGGYGSVVDHVEGEPFARKLNEMGISAFVVFYRVAEQAKFPNPQDDLAKAVRQVMEMSEEKNLDMEHYSVWGSSAGGHLVATFGTEKIGYLKYGLPKPAALILVYPVISMGEIAHEGSKYNLLGENPSNEIIELTSVEKQVSASYPPSFVWCGDADSVVNPDNSRIMAKTLAAAGIPYKFMEFPGVDHGEGLGIGLASEPWFEEAVEFWQDQYADELICKANK